MLRCPDCGKFLTAENVCNSCGKAWRIKITRSGSIKASEIRPRDFAPEITLQMIWDKLHEMEGLIK